MPGFTSVTYQQPRLVPPQQTGPAAQQESEEDQQGAGIGRSLVKAALSKGTRVAAKAGDAASKAGEALSKTSKFVPFEDKIVKVGKAVGKATARAAKKGKEFVPFQEKIRKTAKGSSKLYPKLPKKAMKAASPSTRVKNQIVDGAVMTVVKAGKVGEKLKNKNLTKIVMQAPTRGAAVKGVAKELGKRGGKALTSGLMAGAVAAGAKVTYDYLNHVSDGGEPLSGKELGKIATDAGLGIVKKGLDGKLTKSIVQQEVLDAYNRSIVKKEGGKSLGKRPSLAQTLGRLQKLMKKLNKEHWRRHYAVNGEAPLDLVEPRAFGTGAMAKRRRSGCRKGRGKKNHSKSCSRKGGRKTRRKGGKRRKVDRGGRSTDAKLLRRMQTMFF